ncbi:MAG: glycosyltransferase family 4 protein [Janthinobacterium lividum]
MSLNQTAGEGSTSSITGVGPHDGLQISATSGRKAVVVHAGARDSYQLAWALAERDLLDRLYTDLFWPTDRAFANRLARFLPGFHRQAMQRSSPGIPFGRVRMNVLRGVLSLLVERLRRIPAGLRRRAHRSADAALGSRAGRRAAKTHAGLVSYSYYGYDAMRQYGQPAMLFQVHPHPATVRRLLSEELAAHPDCAESLEQEWELALPEEDFEHLVAETRMASRFMAASTFTRNSLLEHGANPDAISVVPYGVDLDRFQPDEHRSAPVAGARLQLLFVGRINQRKGIKYLLEALKQFDSSDVELTICGRVVDSLDLFRASGVEVKIRPSVSAEELVRAYQTADLFIFPSVAEGFGQVLLESLACGLPILATTHTAAPDLITEGREGFIVEPRRPDLLVERIAWCLGNRATLFDMRKHARSTAERFTWARFRREAAAAVQSYLEETA